MTHQENDKNKFIKQASDRTVDSLQRVYAIVIALALTTAVKLLIESIGITPHEGMSKAASNSLPTIFLFVAFLSTLIVFYHGMNRHLDDTFIIGVKVNPHRLLLLVDIVVFLFEGGLLVVMASTINNPKAFLFAWSVLLCVDIVWGLIVYFTLKRQALMDKWILNNFCFLILAWLFWSLVFPQKTISIAVIEIVRSLIDYWLNWDFYFPKGTLEEFCCSHSRQV